MSGDIASRVTSGVQALGLDGQRQAWQAQHRASLLTDAQTYDDLADALESDLKGRPVDGDRPWSAALRAKQRVKPLRKAAKAMRKAARAVNGTVAAYERTDPQTVAADREAKALRKAQHKGALAGAARNTAARSLERLAPADGEDRPGGEPKVLADFFDPKRKGA